MKLWDRGGVLLARYTVRRRGRSDSESDEDTAGERPPPRTTVPHEQLPVAVVAMPFAGSRAAADSAGQPSAMRAALVLRCGDVHVVDMLATDGGAKRGGAPLPRLKALLQTGSTVALAAAVMPAVSGPRGRRMVGATGGLVVAVSRVQPPPGNQEGGAATSTTPSSAPGEKEPSDAVAANTAEEGDEPVRTRVAPTLFFFDGSLRNTRPSGTLTTHSQGGVAAMSVQGGFLFTAGRVQGGSPDPALRVIDIATMRQVGSASVLGRLTVGPSDAVAWVHAAPPQPSHNGEDLTVLVGTRSGAVRGVRLPVPGATGVMAGRGRAVGSIMLPQGPLVRVKAGCSALSPRGSLLAVANSAGGLFFLSDAPGTVSVGERVIHAGSVNPAVAARSRLRLASHGGVQRSHLPPVQQVGQVPTMRVPPPGAVAPVAAYGVRPREPVGAHGGAAAWSPGAPPPTLDAWAAWGCVPPLLSAQSAVWPQEASAQPRHVVDINGGGAALSPAARERRLLPPRRACVAPLAQDQAIQALLQPGERPPSRAHRGDTPWLVTGKVSFVKVSDLAAAAGRLEGQPPPDPQAPPLRIRPNSHIFGRPEPATMVSADPREQDDDFVLQSPTAGGGAGGVGMGRGTPPAHGKGGRRVLVPSAWRLPAPVLPRFGWDAFDASSTNSHPYSPAVQHIGRNGFLASLLLCVFYSPTLRRAVRRAAPSPKQPLPAECKLWCDLMHATAQRSPEKRLVSPVGVVRALQEHPAAISARVVAPDCFRSPISKLALLRVPLTWDILLEALSKGVEGGAPSAAAAAAALSSATDSPLETAASVAWLAGSGAGKKRDKGPLPASDNPPKFQVPLQYARHAPYAHATGSEARAAAVSHSFEAALARALAVTDRTRAWRIETGSMGRVPAARHVAQLPQLLAVDAHLTDGWQAGLWQQDGWLPQAVKVAVTQQVPEEDTVTSAACGPIRVQRVGVPDKTKVSSGLTSRTYVLVGVVSFIGPDPLAGGGGEGSSPPPATAAQVISSAHAMSNMPKTPVRGAGSGAIAATPDMLSPGTVSTLAAGSDGAGHYVTHLRLGPYASTSTTAKDAQWWRFNGLSVEPSSAQEACVVEEGGWRHPCLLLWADAGAAGVHAARDAAAAKQTAGTVPPALAALAADGSSEVPVSALQLAPLRFAQGPGEEGVAADEAAWNAEVKAAVAYVQQAAQVGTDGAPVLVALDAEFVTVQHQVTHRNSAGDTMMVQPPLQRPGRVSVLTSDGSVLLDTCIACKEEVADYWTRFSGLRAGDLTLGVARTRLSDLTAVSLALRALMDAGAVFVGHGLGKDFEILNLPVPAAQILDTAVLWRRPGQRIFSLRFLAAYLLGEDIQDVQHDSIQDALTALSLLHKYLAVAGLEAVPSSGPAGLPKAEATPKIGVVLDTLYTHGRRTGFKVQGGADAIVGADALLE